MERAIMLVLYVAPGAPEGEESTLENSGELKI